MQHPKSTANDSHISSLDWLWIQLFVANSLIILALKVWSFQRVLTAVRWIAEQFPLDLPEDRERFIVRANRRTLQIRRRGPIRGKCLSRSMALYGVLRRYAIYSSIQIGVKRDSKDFVAHAWVELDNQPINAGPRVRNRHAVFGRSFGG